MQYRGMIEYSYVGGQKEVLLLLPQIQASLSLVDGSRVQVRPPETLNPQRVLLGSGGLKR